MNILINLIPIKKGGGQQVAANFVNNLNLAINMGFSLNICCTEGTEVHKILQDNKNIKLFLVPNTLKGRVKFSLFEYDKILKDQKINIVYTLFGPALPKRKGILNIVGCAYSNIFYPEVKFWANWPLKKRLLSKVIDYYRLKSTLGADAIIFENESMKLRSNSIFNFPKENSIFIKPSVSSHLIKNERVYAADEAPVKEDAKKHVLLLTGWHLNKNLQALPSIAHSLQKKEVKDIVFTITISPDHPGATKLLEEAKELNVTQYFNFIGTVSPFELDKLYNGSYVVMLLSLLESFSNNIIESWAMRKPLIISDLEWSKSICKNAAYYVDRDNHDAVANAIIELLRDNSLYENLVAEGLKELTSYPSPVEKVKLQFEFIQKLHEKRA